MQPISQFGWLIANEGSSNETHIQLTDSQTFLGRESSCAINLADPKASRQHAVIQKSQDGFQIKDLNSTNGTLLNGEKITTALLNNGDQIQIGDTILRFQMDQDEDRTVVQRKPLTRDSAVSKPAIPPYYETDPCQECQHLNPSGTRFCSQCGAALPQLPDVFQQAQLEFSGIQEAYARGEISEAGYLDALTSIMVQDAQGEYWMLGAESGKWYWYNGEYWIKRKPEPIPPDPAQVFNPTIPRRPSRDRDSSAASDGRVKRLLVLGIWVVSALLVLGFGGYSVLQVPSVLQSLRTGQLESPSSSIDAIDLDEISPSSTPSGDLPSQESGEPVTTPSVLESPQVTLGQMNGYRLRRYNSAEDKILPSFTGSVELIEDQSTETYSFYTGEFPTGIPGILSMDWCTIDQPTLENNMAIIQMEGFIDGELISPEMWTVEDAPRNGMVCRTYQAVLEEIGPGNHYFLWTTSYQAPVFDGWDTYPPGTYQTQYNISVEDHY